MFGFETWVLIYAIRSIDMNHEAKALASGSAEFSSLQRCDETGQQLQIAWENAHIRLSYKCVKK